MSDKDILNQPHDVKSRDKGFVNDIYVPGNKHTAADLKRNLEENYKCRRCGKQLKSEYEVNNFTCYTEIKAGAK